MQMHVEIWLRNRVYISITKLEFFKNICTKVVINPHREWMDLKGASAAESNCFKGAGGG